MGTSSDTIKLPYGIQNRYFLSTFHVDFDKMMNNCRRLLHPRKPRRLSKKRSTRSQNVDLV